MSDTTRLSSKGQVIIPKHVRDARHWKTGQEFLVLETGDGVLLKAKQPFPDSTLDEVAGSLHYKGSPKSLEDMEEAIAKGVAEQMDKTTYGDAE